ncbi:RNA polymerase sigma factor [Dyadobacter sp. NIV53]|uniref:RNA polymerase sigma factor n=1 Tax=Dyadobacter sp. NIV53 TaxID=2861765 RepID=UPI001C88D0A1|nr:RNA polymerase sigma factor [Dyadobacter sp. NIV53]
MLKVKSGDLDKMGLLFERYHRPLYTFLYHMTSRDDACQDMVQNVFYRMLKYRHTFTGEGEFKTWMYHLARNVLNDYARQNKSANHADVHELADRLEGGVKADAAFENYQDTESLHNAMAGLSPEHKEVLALSRFQELKYSEIAKIINISEGAVKVRVHRAMEELKKIFLKNNRKMA